MNARIFNICLALGWLMVVAGTCALSLPAGLITGGVLMLGIIVSVARFAGIYLPKSDG